MSNIYYAMPNEVFSCSESGGSDGLHQAQIAGPDEAANGGGDRG